MCEHVTEIQTYLFPTFFFFFLKMSMLTIGYCLAGLQKHFIRRASPFITQKKKIELKKKKCEDNDPSGV